MANYETQLNTKVELDYTSISFLSPLISDYVNHPEKLADFYSYQPNINVFEKVMADKQKQPINRQLLTDVVTKQYKKLSPTTTVINNINLLKEKNTFTITTAHQPNVFTGFLYLVYKVISTINTAEQLKAKYPNYNFVPVYWIGSEDHDFEEISAVNLQGEKLKWQTKQTGAVGKMSVEEILPLINQVAVLLHGRPFTDDLISLLKDAYTEPTLGAATQYLVNELFGEYGLVIIDQDDGQLKQPFIKIMQDELLNAITESKVGSTITQLSSNNYKIQANPRAINIFYLTDTFRERIVWNAAKSVFEVLNTELSFTKETLLELIENEPEKISPNVFLRPVFQELVLPNLAYVGGGGELAYWLELKALFDHCSVNFPMLILRNSVTLVDKGTQNKIEKLELTYTELFDSEDELLKKYVRDNSEAQLDLTMQKTQTQQLYQSISNIAKSIDPTLEKTVKSQLQAQLKALDVLEKKMIRGEKRNFEVAANQIKAIKTKLFPQGIPQERYDNFMQYYAMYGTAWIKLLKDNLNPLNKQFTFLNID